MMLVLMIASTDDNSYNANNDVTNILWLHGVMRSGVLSSL